MHHTFRLHRKHKPEFNFLSFLSFGFVCWFILYLCVRYLYFACTPQQKPKSHLEHTNKLLNGDWWGGWVLCAKASAIMRPRHPAGRRCQNISMSSTYTFLYPQNACVLAKWLAGRISRFRACIRGVILSLLYVESILRTSNNAVYDVCWLVRVLADWGGEGCTIHQIMCIYLFRSKIVVASAHVTLIQTPTIVFCRWWVMVQARLLVIVCMCVYVLCDFGYVNCAMLILGDRNASVLVLSIYTKIYICVLIMYEFFFYIYIDTTSNDSASLYCNLCINRENRRSRLHIFIRTNCATERDI